MSELLNHLWQSTLFAVVIGCLCFAMRGTHARTRYWLWLAASVKFLLPFSLLVSLGQRVERPTTRPQVEAQTVERITSTFAPAALVVTEDAPATGRPAWPVIWVVGAAVVAGRWLREWIRLRAIRRTARRVWLGIPVPVYETGADVEPGVFGIWRQALVLPEGLASKLTPEQLEAVLAHEVTHARHRDNLTAALHMGATAVFWYHPLIWWIGARLVEERERACDEAVVAEGKARAEYARGILNVCKHYVGSPLPCAAGVSGADLRKRIAAILTDPMPAGLKGWSKALLCCGVAVVVAVPLILGGLQGQTATDGFKFEVASIRPAAPGRGSSSSMHTSQARMTTSNTTLRQLVLFAYSVQEYQLTGGPEWVLSERYDIVANYDASEDNVTASEVSRQKSRDARIKARLRHLLAERFQLKLREETKELPIFGLVVDRGGHKFKADPDGKGNMNVNENNGSGVLRGDGLTMERLAVTLSGKLGRPVVDETGLAGLFAVEMKWTADGAGDGGPTIYTALKEQLGLRLESKKGPVKTYVIEGVAKPTEN
ncbi:MAG: TIGR03435 family protein [Acidobacteria bacterium]|nr:TIGR03435 family protein [Acidobacteriota bacterium]